MSKSEIIDLNAAAKQANAQANSRTSRLYARIGAMLGMSKEGKRDVYEIYGYDTELGGEAGFLRMYQYANRQGVANRITHGVPRTCWRDGFTVQADPDDDETVQLVDELAELGRAGLFRKLEQADILNRIGRFSVLLVGVPDGRDLHMPVGPVAGDGIKAVYFKAYAYDGVEITQYETDPYNSRYGLPVMYQLRRTVRRNNDKDRSQATAIRAHYTRVVHMVESALDSEIEGNGALEPIFNRILDLEKATGGASEAYFRNARGKLGYEVDKEFAAQLLTDQTAKDAFDEGARKYTDDWQDHTIAAGATVKSLPTAHYSPLDTVKTSLWEISAYTGIPLRVLTGEGSGQLAGSEDQLAYNQIVADRQRLTCTGWVLGVLGVLEMARIIALDPSWVVMFPQQKAATEAQQADIDNKKADTLNKVTASTSSIGGDSIVLESALQACGLSEIETDENVQ